MIVKKEKAKRRQFLGVDFVLLSHGPASMVTKMLYKSTDKVPCHSHPNEQSGYVISGRYRLYVNDIPYEIGPQDSYTIPADAPHYIEIIEPGEVVDVFTPPRNEYL
jgi:quercetin dioxygenase-like cupin family protein